MLVDINALARKAKAQPAYWLESPDGDWFGCEDYCGECAEAKAKEHEHCEVCGPLQFETNDGCRHCAACGALLHYTLTDYGVRAEMEHYIENGVRYPLTPEEAYHLQAIEDQLPHMGETW